MKRNIDTLLYRFGISAGFATLLKYPIYGIKSIINPLDYWRFVEAPYVISNLNIEHSDKVLDIGSPKMIGLYISSKLGATVYTTDIMNYFIDRYRAYYNCYSSRAKINAKNKYILEVQDVRKLKYPDNHFDKIFSVSVLEHIPDDGDTKAIIEISRVLKEDGIVSLTIPFSNKYRETYEQRDIYERRLEDEKGNFYQRHYDQDAINEHLIKPSGLELLDLSYYKERYFHFENFITKAPKGLNLLTLPFQILFSRLFLCKCSRAETKEAMTVGLTLRKKQPNL